MLGKPHHHAGRKLVCMDRPLRVFWPMDSWLGATISHLLSVQRSLLMIPAPKHWAFQLNARHRRVKTSHPHCAWSEFLTHKNWDDDDNDCFKLLSFGAICYTATDNSYTCLPEGSLSRSLRHFSLYWAHLRVVSSRRDPVTWAEENHSDPQFTTEVALWPFQHKLQNFPLKWP